MAGIFKIEKGRGIFSSRATVGLIVHDEDEKVSVAFAEDEKGMRMMFGFDPASAGMNRLNAMFTSVPSNNQQLNPVREAAVDRAEMLLTRMLAAVRKLKPLVKPPEPTAEVDKPPTPDQIAAVVATPVESPPAPLVEIAKEQDKGGAAPIVQPAVEAPQVSTPSA
jgi:hypothetical protein